MVKKNINIPNIIIGTLVLTVVFFFLSESVFAKENIVCPEDYVCLKKDDQLILASTTPCFLNILATGGTVNVYDSEGGGNDNTDNTPGTYTENSNKNDKDGINIFLDNKNEDHAGIWEKFEPGKGTNGDSEDWGWKIIINSKVPKVIQSISIVDESYNQGWSTTDSQELTGKRLYPLVIMDNSGNQLNESYNTTFTLNSGKTVFNLFGQIENPNFFTTFVHIIFSDNTYVDSQVKEKGSPQDYEELNSVGADQESSFWDSLKNLFGF